jgi:subtilisin family serine protease
MPHVNFGTKNEPGFELVESPDLIAVRTRDRQPVLGIGPVPQPTASEVGDGDVVLSFPDAGVEVFRVPPEKKSIEDRKRDLRAVPAVQFAGSVLVNPDSGKPVVYTENLYIKFREDLDPDDCEAIIRDAGLTVKERLGFATNAYFAAAPEGTGQKVFDIANNLLQRDEVVNCHPELVQERVAKVVFPQQWHLKPTVVGGVAVNAHANVEAAHAATQGAGITVAVIDDGVDIDHPEFSSAAKVVAPRDATLQTNNPRPKSSGEKHGTACAGVACGSGLDGASGVAPLANLMPIRLSSGLGSIREAEAFRWAADNGADIISCSWGPADGEWWNVNDPTHIQMVQLPTSTRDAIDYAATQGRGGKGCVVLFAAGNGNESVQFDGYASYANVIAVAACNDTGSRSVYSDFGQAVWCSFPSSDFGHAPFGHPDALTTGIWTTDRVGSAGYNSGNVLSGDAAGKYTNSFGGTSSACPGAAGVAALVLSANPALRMDEVRDILKRSCDQIDQAGGQYDANGHSDLYGFGRLNAASAVANAKQSVSQFVKVERTLSEPIPDQGSAEGQLDVSGTGNVQRITVQVKLEHTYIGDLVISLIPPAGSGLPTVVLHNRSGGSRNDIDTQYDVSNTPALAAIAGTQCNGAWTIRVEDKAAIDSGTLTQIGISFF